MKGFEKPAAFVLDGIEGDEFDAGDSGVVEGELHRQYLLGR